MHIILVIIFNQNEICYFQTLEVYIEKSFKQNEETAREMLIVDEPIRH